MTDDRTKANPSTKVDLERRRLLGAAGAGVVAATLGGAFTTPSTISAQPVKTLSWGIVGTGGIANSMAPRIREAEHAGLAAVSSRKMTTAKAFAGTHQIDHAFDSWADMLAFDGVDAVYIATPTSVREEIAIAAAKAGKHVLGEKPFANLPSLKRITSACRDSGVGFMDGTHFVHHPRTLQIKSEIAALIGRHDSLASAFQFSLTDKTNIRLNPQLEPYGAIGDTGWYNMRAVVEYLPDDAEMVSADAYLRRDQDSGAVVAGSGILTFSDGTTSTFHCGFDSGGMVMDLRIAGSQGVIKMDDFLSQRRTDHAGVYRYGTGWGSSEEIEIPSTKTAATLMFEDFAVMTLDKATFEASVRASERTQRLLDAVWKSATKNESV